LLGLVCCPCASGQIPVDPINTAAANVLMIFFIGFIPNSLIDIGTLSFKIKPDVFCRPVVSVTHRTFVFESRSAMTDHTKRTNAAPTYIRIMAETPVQHKYLKHDFRGSRQVYLCCPDKDYKRKK
jgi:hypothetical protein